MEQMRVVMEYLVNDLEQIVMDEINDCTFWLEHTYELLKGTGDDNAQLQERRQRCIDHIKRGTATLGWLKQERVLSEFGLQLLDQNLKYYVADLWRYKDIHAYAGVGIMSAWVAEWKNMEAKVIEFNMNGDWSGHNEDYTLVEEA